MTLTNVLIQLFLCAINLVTAHYMNESGNYKTAYFNIFVAGFCFAGAVFPLIDN